MYIIIRMHIYARAVYLSLYAPLIRNTVIPQIYSHVCDLCMCIDKRT